MVKVTSALIAEVADLVQVGVPPLVACMAQGWTELDFAEVVHAGREATTNTNERKLVKAIDQAEARGEAILIGKIRTAASSSWQAAAWLAERRFPERYVRKSVNERAGGGDPAAGEAGPVDPFSDIDNVTPLRRGQ